ncbi:MAG TPA: glycogen synthase GlgA [Candidatus Polarisedimenticolia bacterium]|nr:glycogen synthase GlgA [Candidatus Polarisedimenticolia bacterium]
MRPLTIWMCAAEAAPWAQTGGLADVLRALPPALAKRGHQVRVILPAYGGIDRDKFDYDPVGDHLDVPVGIGRVPLRTMSRTLGDGVTLTLLRNEELFGRRGYYGTGGGDFPDNARRFALLVAATVAMAARLERAPDILHGHDWHAGLLPLLTRAARWRGRMPGTVHTIHNMGYQGHFSDRDIDWVAPPGPLRDAVFRTEGIEYGGGINYLKAAILYADRITAVSPRYAWEITTPEGGFGLHDVARQRGPALVGILNGADYDRWDPATDAHLPERYDARSLERKEASRTALRAQFGLDPAEPQRPILGVVSRLVDQKGIDLVLEASPALLSGGADLVVLGSGDPRIVEGLENLRRIHPKRVGIFIGFNEPLSHKVVAGSDLLLIPSRYEPCGLVQMHAMRYGTLPVVHKTGGLADTVRDESAQPGQGTGFVFENVHPGALAHAVDRALTLRARNPEAWEALRRRAVAADFSWSRSAEAYEALYRPIAA